MGSRTRIHPFELRELEAEYEAAFGAKLPRAFRDAYEALSGAIYEGLPPERGSRKSRSVGDVWPLHRWDLIPTKDKADKVLAEVTDSIRRWKGQSEG